MKKLLIGLWLFFSIFESIAEDIELYVGTTAQRVGNKAQVLIIFDNSNSMTTPEEVVASYDPNIIYPAVGGLNSLSERFVYFTKGTGIDNTNIPVPDSPSESRRFLDSINSCQTARERLATNGYYTGHIREYSFSGNSGSWQEIPDNNGANIEIIDCWDDIQLARPENAGILKDGTPLPDGYPIDGEGSKRNPVYFTPNINQTNTALGTGEVVTLYTDNYLRWYRNETLATVSRTRLEIAQETVTSLIESAPSIDFGLQIFNLDFPFEGSRDGGRVVFGIQDSNDVARNKLKNIINNQIRAETNTPLCESLYEAMRYFGGKSVYFGDDDSNFSFWYKGNNPPRDTTIISSSSTYISPYTGCNNEVYVILITDGVPSLDNSADNLISALPNIGAPLSVNGINNYLAALAGWMHTNDINSSLDGIQTATTFTVGFSSGAESAAPLLLEAAELGGGKYYSARDSFSLLSALQSALIEILRVNATFTAPSIASNNFDRTETLDSVYYAMFLPDRGPRWQGNIKKLKLKEGEQVDRNNVLAIDDEGNIEATAKTFWSTSNSPDGGNVADGGVAEMLRNKTTRTIYSNLETNGALTNFNKVNASTALSGDTELANFMGVNEADLDSYFQWAIGKDIDDSDNDGDVTDIRKDVFSDPLHSKPLIVNYGGSANNQDIRIIVGTNSGMLHMFKDAGNTVDETWAFMPKEFLPNIAALRSNFAGTDKIYGLDGSATVYVYDKGGDGTINKIDGDKAWVFIGSRRGGSSYYALDISDPDIPTLLWHINENSTGFSELGQSWSKPKVGFSKLNIENNTLKPVLFFGGGYDTAKDNAGSGTDDTKGRAIYLVDAQSGNLVWSFSPAASSSSTKNTKVETLSDSIPSSVSIMDSDSDGLIDRIYTGDTGGNVWRIDMPGDSPLDNDRPWTAVKLASLGGDNNNDRRFFDEPSVVRALITNTVQNTVDNGDGTETVSVSRYERPYDAILIGSGDRTRPSSTHVDDKFFMIKDENIITESLISQNIPSIITINDLADFTNNPYGQTLSTAERDALDLFVSSKSGWLINYEGSGEKSVSQAIAIAGVAYFNSFTPASTSVVGQCELNAGEGKLYAVGLSQGTTIYNWRSLDIGDRIPDTPTIVIPPEAPTEDTNGDGLIDETDIVSSPRLRLVGVGKGVDENGGEGTGTITVCDAQDCDPNEGITLETMRTYLYVEEQN